MRSLSKWDAGTRKIRDPHPSFHETLNSGGGIVGSPYVALDLPAKLMIWISTLVVGILAFTLKGPGAFLYVLVGAPITIPLAFMFARMHVSRDWNRVVATLYIIGMMFVFVMLPNTTQ